MMNHTKENETPMTLAHRLARKALVVAMLLVAVATLSHCGAPKSEWELLEDHTAKLTFMGTKVYGPMQTMFAEHNSDRYGDGKFQCETCHGADASDKKYAMPNGVFPMDPNNVPTEDDPTYGATVKFMKEQVMPKMKELLGIEMTCFSCHATK